MLHILFDRDRYLDNEAERRLKKGPMANEVNVVSNFRDEESLRFVHCLSNRDPNVRNEGFESITRSIDAWIDGYGSPPAPDGTPTLSVLNGVTANPDELLTEHILDLVRLSLQCPFEDVRERCGNLLEDLQVCSYITCHVLWKTSILCNLFSSKAGSATASICQLG
jgi:hypothetical protein